MFFAKKSEKIGSQIFVFDFRKNQNLALICSENASTVEKNPMELEFVARYSTMKIRG